MEKSNLKLLILIMSLIGLVLMGCQKRDRKSPTSKRRSGTISDRLLDPKRNAVTTGSCTASNASELNGFMYVDDVDEAAFQDAVYDFLTAMGDPYEDLELGSISGSCSASNNTGIRFLGNVYTSNGQFSASAPTVDTIDASSDFVMVIFDSTSVNGDVDGIGISAGDAWGNVRSQSDIEVNFEWNNGYISLVGGIVGSNFEGVVYYDNKTHFDGGEGFYGALARFKVPACSFFRCN